MRKLKQGQSLSDCPCLAFYEAFRYRSLASNHLPERLGLRHRPFLIGFEKSACPLDFARWNSADETQHAHRRHRCLAAMQNADKGVDFHFRFTRRHRRNHPEIPRSRQADATGTGGRKRKRRIKRQGRAESRTIAPTGWRYPVGMPGENAVMTTRGRRQMGFFISTFRAAFAF